MDKRTGGRPRTIDDARMFSFFISTAVLGKLQASCGKGQVGSVIRRLIEEFLARREGSEGVEHP